MKIPIILMVKGSVILTDEVHGYVEEKMQKIEKLIGDDSSARADVELGTTGGSRTGNEFRAEINLKVAGGFHRAEASRETLHAAIDEAVEELRTELHRSVTKHRDLMRRGASKVKDIFRYWTGM